MKRGDLVRVMDHNLPGYGWTIGQVGSILCADHAADFDVMHTSQVERPPVREDWWIVSVSHPKAKGGYAFAALPEERLAPHACTDRCSEHLCR